MRGQSHTASKKMDEGQSDCLLRKRHSIQQGQVPAHNYCVLQERGEEEDNEVDRKTS